MTELSYFEQLSTQTPKKQPYAILIGFVVAIFILWLIRILAPTESALDLKKAQQQQMMPAATQAGGQDMDEL